MDTAIVLAFSTASANDAVNLRITLSDAATGQLVPGRVTVEARLVGSEPTYYFVESLDPKGSAIPYDVVRSPTSFEKHTTV